ncbi:unnamed protein product [Linum trigynum]|uniref:Uncharacterized protein n=1 Tax=Linum trigynum TaxID=586398 RepID=A0AAV2CZE1_9ROSI
MGNYKTRSEKAFNAAPDVPRCTTDLESFRLKRNHMRPPTLPRCTTRRYPDAPPDVTQNPRSVARIVEGNHHYTHLNPLSKP